MRRIGVSIAVPDPWGKQLQDYRVRLGDVAAEQIPTHVTLFPPLEVPLAEMDTILEHLAQAACSVGPFAVHLRSTGSFRPVSPVVFINVVQGISELELLADAVRRGPLAVQSEFPYHPHVTIAQGLDDALLDRAFADLADFDAAFTVDEFWLYLHDDLVGWQPHRAFPLGP